MFKKNVLTLAILVLTFIVFSFIINPQMQNANMSEVSEVCQNNEGTKACSDAMNKTYQSSIKSGIVYIALGLSMIAYSIYFIVKVGTVHAEKNINSVFYRITNKFFEFEDSVEQLILHSNKPYAPKMVAVENASLAGLVPMNEKSNGTGHKYIYEKKEVQGKELFVLVKSI